MSTMKFKPAPPRAAALVESLRGMGYTTSTALADVIDNSISAGATKIRVDFGWDAGNSFVRVCDDGRGLNADQLDEAMTMGSTSPIELRTSNDLGRFGMGLKTASLSQCRRLTIASKSGRDINYRCWDIDFIASELGGGWALLLEPYPSARKMCEDPFRGGFSTVVLWEGLDRVLSRGFCEEDFFELIDDVERHLAMTFHRFLEGPNPGVRIFINGEGQGQQVRPWDPFMRAHDATSATPEEILADGVTVQGFVLPHREKLTDKEFGEGGGAAGWVTRQGFYVYRGRRLLVAGSWLGLGDDRTWPKDDLHRLARMRLDLPNNQDQEWRIDIKKSNAKPPVGIRQRLVELARAVRTDARRVFTHRGELGSPRTKSPVASVWRVSAVATEPRYRIDESHPVIARLLEDAGVFGGRVRQVFRMVEETVPIQRIWLDASENIDAKPVAENDHVPADLMELMQEHFLKLIASRAMTAEAAREHLLRTAPFNRFPMAVAALTQTMKGLEG